MKLTGVATATAIACAGSSARPASTSRLRTIRLTARPARLTVKNRAAWKPAWSPRAPCERKVQIRLRTKLFVTATQKAPTAASVCWISVASVRKAKTIRLMT
jgi:hypothetical protein